ncbi:hypothetical protein PRIPAC_95878 [Pristionchus pacificus]|nr:hypothetical protein PRIPAC_95878 [Pristionchus pacificus]
MAHYCASLLLLIIPNILGQQYTNTFVDLAQISFTTNQNYIYYFPAGTTGNGMKVQLECQASTNTGQAKLQMSKLISVTNDQRTAMIDNMSFELSNPADWVTVTCTARLTMTDDNGAPLSSTAIVQLFSAANDEDFAPNRFPIEGQQKRFSDMQEWMIQASINKRCAGGESMNFNCDSNCIQSMCNNNNAKICCTEQVNQDQCSCIPNPFTLSTSPTTVCPVGNNDPDFCTNEDLYFWIMIGLACLSGLLLLLLIICLSYICCALSREDEARKTQQTEPVRPPPPVYLSTPPRDPRYGYRGPPLDPYGRPEAGYREEYDADFDSIAAEWTEPSERREARV